MLTKSRVSAVALILMSTTAFAADLPSRRAPPVYVPPPPPTFTWTGFYAGVNVGGGFSDYTTYGLAGQTPAARNTLLNTGGRPSFLETNSSGVLGGGQIGYNFQINQGILGGALNSFGNVLTPVTGLFGGGAYSGPVAGIEADADATSFRRSVGVLGPTGLGTAASSRLDFLGTVRGRLGYGFGNLLVFGTGGFAYGGVSDNALLYNAAGVQTSGGGVNRIQTGYVYGGGVEYAIPTSSFLNVFKSSAVTLKVEYLHYVIGDNVGVKTNCAGAHDYTIRVLNDGNLVRAGINYKFDFGTAAPVVARY